MINHQKNWKQKENIGGKIEIFFFYIYIKDVKDFTKWAWCYTKLTIPTKNVVSFLVC